MRTTCTMRPRRGEVWLLREAPGRPASVRETPPAIGPYSMRLEWDPRDSIYVVTVPELPGCMTRGATVGGSGAEGARGDRELDRRGPGLGRPDPPAARVRLSAAGRGVTDG